MFFSSFCGRFIDTFKVDEGSIGSECSRNLMIPFCILCEKEKKEGKKERKKERTVSIPRIMGMVSGRLKDRLIIHFTVAFRRSNDLEHSKDTVIPLNLNLQ